MLRRRLTYANVISSLALFVALGGTGYAVTKLPRNSVGSTQLKANAVTSAKIRPRAVQRSDLAPSARSGARGPRGAAGPSGPAGATGPSETIQVKRPQEVLIPASAGGTATLASITLSPGPWRIDAHTSLVYALPTPQADAFDCQLRTASGEILSSASMQVGQNPGSAVRGNVSTQAAANFAVASQVSFVCTHGTAGPGEASAYGATLLATRVGSVENR